MSDFTIAKSCPCGVHVTVIGDDSKTNLVTATLERLFSEHDCGLATIKPAEMYAVAAPPPLYQPTDGPPWPLAQALYYQYYRDKPAHRRPPHWDDLSDAIKTGWCGVAEAAIQIVAKGKDPDDFMNPAC